MSVSSRLGALLLVAAAPALHAQERDALAVPRGTIRLQAGAEYAQWSSRYGAGGGEDPLGAPFSVRLSPPAFAPLERTERELQRFFRATDARAGTSGVSEEVTLGTLDLGAAAERVRLPFFAELGITRRVAVGAGFTLERAGVELQRARLAGGSVGLNPDSAANRQALAALDPAFGNLGGARFLPDSASALGQELLRRANLLAGGNAGLRLPSSALRVNAGLSGDSLPVAQLAEADRWRPGAVTAGVRLQLSGAAETPTTRGIRSALLLRTAIALREDSEPLGALTPDREVSTAEISAELRADLVASERVWVAAGAQFTRRWEGSVRRTVLDPTDPFAPIATRSLRVDPGDGWSADIAPRFQLTEAIGLVGAFAFARRGADTGPGEDPAPLLLPGERSVATAAAGARFTTIPAWSRGSRILPLEAEILFFRTVDGGGGVPQTAGVDATARVYRRLWGGPAPLDR